MEEVPPPSSGPLLPYALANHHVPTFMLSQQSFTVFRELKTVPVQSQEPAARLEDLELTPAPVNSLPPPPAVNSLLPPHSCPRELTPAPVKDVASQTPHGCIPGFLCQVPITLPGPGGMASQMPLQWRIQVSLPRSLRAPLPPWSPGDEVTHSSILFCPSFPRLEAGWF